MVSQTKSTHFGEHRSAVSIVTFANADVLAFYRTLPFNYRESVAGSAEAIKTHDPRAAYPPLAALLRDNARILDVGCGAGWFANSVSYHCGCSVVGIDFNQIAVERAQEVAGALSVSTEFQTADLFTYEPAELFDVVVSLGVLHHTNDCIAAVRRVCEFVKPGGHLFIGLYHKFGREPFLDYFRKMRNNGATEEAMLSRYKELHSGLQDETLLHSWFRDQVLHPHETQHTLEEMMPVITGTGMTLVSTSLNRFAPIHSLEEVYAEERKQYDVAVQRLKKNQYFTGFFVFLARKNELTRSLDTKQYVEYDPLVGYRYIPNFDMMLPRPGGGAYHIQTNSKGIRTSREYAFKRPSGVTRAILCGDSMAAGQFVSNEQRLSEQLERRIPGLEVVNLSLEGSGTDQQLLLYEQVGLQYEHDFLIVMPFLSNVRRNMVIAREAFDAKTGMRVLRGKPRFELVNGQLELRNVPVPKEYLNSEPEHGVTTDTPNSFVSHLKTRLSAFPGISYLKKLVYFFIPWEPFPEFRNPASKEWQLMEAIIHRFRQSAGDRPIVIVPMFYDNYVRYRMSRNYWKRFRSLEVVPRTFVIDLLPHLRQLGAAALRCFQSPHDMHLSAYGHLMVAEVLEKEFLHLGILSRHSGQE